MTSSGPLWSNLVSALSSIAIASFAGVQLYKEIQENERVLWERQDQWRRNWNDLYGKWKRMRDDLSFIIPTGTPENARGSLDTLPLAMAREFEAKCLLPANVSESDRKLCAELQEFRHLGRTMMGEVEITNPNRHVRYLQKQGYNEAINVLLPTMALDAANAKSILKTRKGEPGEPVIKEIQFSQFGPVLLLLLLIKDEVNLRVLRDAKASHKTLPKGAEFALTKGDDYLKILPRDSKAAQLLRDFVDACRQER